MPNRLRVLKQAVLNSAAIFVGKLEVFEHLFVAREFVVTLLLSELQCNKIFFLSIFSR